MSCDFFLYLPADDLAAARRFYSDLLGLEQIWDTEDSLAYQVGATVQLTIGREETAVPAGPGWSYQPGWVHGLGVHPAPSHAAASWSIALAPEQFWAAVRRLQAASVESLRAEPFWVGYWSFVVRDPMGCTVELSDPSSPAPTELDLSGADPAPADPAPDRPDPAQPSTNRPTT